jgi:homoserine O-acetyltransferase
MTDKSLGIVETKYFTFAEAPNELKLESGEKLGPITVAYETYGKLNKDKSNAVLITHAFSGDAHAAGYHEGDDKPGWWDAMIGPGKGFDTDKYYVICSNVIGGCGGTTGPSSENPETGKPYGLDFPLISINDMVNVQNKLLEHLKIKKLLTVAGGSMGGMQALSWLVKHPEKIKSAIIIASAIKHSPQQIAFDEVGRVSIISDPAWNDGEYYGKETPARGLALARMVGHITYMSDKSMMEKFGRRIRNVKERHKFNTGFEIENYLHYRGSNFVKRFDANSYLYITKAIDCYDASEGKNLSEILHGVKAKVMVIAFKSDWLYPKYQAKEIITACKVAGIDTTSCEIESTYGHDAFLLEIKEETQLIKHFLEKVVQAG